MKPEGRVIKAIGFAAFILATILVAMVPMGSAVGIGGNFNYIGNTTPVQKVLIGQNIQFNLTEPDNNFSSAPTVYRYVAGQLENIFVPDVNGRIYNLNWPTSGDYYVNASPMPAENPTVYDAQLSVEASTLPLTLKVGEIAVSSIAVGTLLRVDTGGINLFDEDRVDLLVYGPDGKITVNPSNASQVFSGPTGINVSSLTLYGSTDPALQIDTTGWKVGAYTFQIKTKPEYACGLDAQSAVKNLTIVIPEITINAEKTGVIELETVKLTVTGVPGRKITVRAYPLNPHVIFPVGINDNPNTVDSNWFNTTIDPDSTRVYTVKFNDTGIYTIKVIDWGNNGIFEGTYDYQGVPCIAGGDDSEATVDITVSEKAVIFDVPSTVTIGDTFMINGTANIGTTVDIAVEYYVDPLLDDLVIGENGTFSVEIDTATAGIPAFTLTGPVRLSAYIDRAAGLGWTPPWESDDGSAKIYMLNAAGGSIAIFASEDFIGVNETILLTIESVPNHNVSVTTADPTPTVFEYNRRDFTGTKGNILNRAPADTISIPTDVGDCASQAEAMNIHGVWKTMDENGVRQFEVHFTATGTYTITATDYGTDYPTATRLDEKSVIITVPEKNVTFDVPPIVVIGERLTIKGTAKTGTTVDIAVDDYVYSELNDLVIDANKQFSKTIDTATSFGAGTAFRVHGWVRLTAYIDRAEGPGWTPPWESDDGYAHILMVRPWLTASLSTDLVDLDDDFTITGTARGSKSVDILIVSPRGSAGTKIDGTAKSTMPLCPEKGAVGIYLSSASVSDIDGTFFKKIWVGEVVDTGPYLVAVISPGSDGLYGKRGHASLEEAMCEYSIIGKTQDEILAILDDLVAMSDDLLRVQWINVGPVETLTLNSIPDVIVGEQLRVTGTSSRREGSLIWITVKGRYYELVPQAVIVTDNTFSATFDTTGAEPGTYTVEAIDGYGYTAVTNVNILMSEITTPFPLTEGWNLIGWYSTEEAPLGEEAVAEDPLNVTPKNSITSIYRYNTSKGEFEKCDHFDGWGWWPATGSESFIKLELGNGYWVMAKNECVWRMRVGL